MKKEMIVLFLIATVSSVLGANAWTGAAGDGLWTTSANWSAGYPDTGNQMQVQGDGQVVNVLPGDDITVSRMLWLSSSAYNYTTTTVNFTGGSFVCAGYWMTSNAVTSDTDPNQGSVINISGDAYVETKSMSMGVVGPNGSGHTCLTNLYITDNAKLYVTETTAGSGYRYGGFVAPGELNKSIRANTFISGNGILEANYFVMGYDEAAYISINDNGILKIKGDYQSSVSALIANNQIYTDGGATTPVVTYDGSYTTVMSPNNAILLVPNTPVPADGANTYTITNLSWIPGDAGSTWDLYIGTEVDNLAIAASGLTTPEYQLTGLDFDTTYYWQIKELNGALTIPGDVWSFYVRDYIQLFWFEYADQAALEADWTASNVTLSPSTDPARGAAALTITYDNSVSPYYGGASSTAIPLDGNLSCTGAAAMTIWFYGAAGNSDETVYVTLSDGTNSATLYYPEAGLTQMEEWVTWNIDILDFTDTNPSLDMCGITEIVIGVGDPASPSAGGQGTIYVDNVNLFPVRCINQPLTDVNDDCVVDIKDLADMSVEWLNNGLFPIQTN